MVGQGRVDAQWAEEVVVLTGATGTLGVHIFHQLRTSDKVKEIHCLIRGATQHAAEERLHKALTHKHLPPIDQAKAAIYIHTCDLRDDNNLGLTQETYNRLKSTSTLIIHAAWAVNFSLPLAGFEDQLASLRNLLSLSASSLQSDSASFLFCSSTASVLGHVAPTTIEEHVYADPNIASEIGYARSKWVAERICDKIQKEQHLPIAIARIGQLCGDEETGTWNVSEAWPLMLSSAKVTNTLPMLDEKLNWLKVDLAARAVVQISFSLLEKRRQDHQLQPSLPVFHVLNNNTEPRWSDMLGWIKRWQSGLEIIPPAAWVEKVESLTGQAGEHPSRKLLGLWKAAYCGDQEQVRGKETVFDMQATLEVAAILSDVQPLDESYMAKVWDWVQREM